MAIEILKKMSIEEFNRTCNEITEAMGFRITSSVYKGDQVVVDAVLNIPGEQRYILIFYRKDFVLKKDIEDLVVLEAKDIKWIVMITGSFSEDALQFGEKNGLVLIDQKGMEKIIKDTGVTVKWEEQEKKEEIQQSKILPSLGEADNNLQWSRDFLKSRNYDKAMDYAEKALAIKESREGWLLKGHIYHEMVKYQEALDSYLKVISLDPTGPEGWYYLGITLEDMGREEEAMEAFNHVIELDENYNMAWFKKGLIMQKKGMNDEALLCYNNILKNDKRDYAAWNNKGVVLKNMGNYEEAQKCFDISYELNNEYIESILNKAELLYEQKKYEMAENEIYLYLKSRPDDKNALKILAYSTYNRGFKKDSLAIFEKILDLDPMEDEIKKKIVAIKLELESEGKNVPVQANPELKPIQSDNEAREIFSKALEKYQELKFDEAIAYLNLILDRNPNHFGAKLLKEQILIEKK